MLYKNAFNLLLQFEGTSFTQTLHDAGGKTKFGISEKAYPQLDIESLTKEEAENIYYTDYWNKCKCSNLPDELQYIVFDTAVNCGQATAIMFLQKIAGITQDGLMGEQTLHAAASITMKQYAALRKAHYEDIISKSPSQEKFKTGWFSRVDKIITLNKK